MRRTPRRTRCTPNRRLTAATVAAAATVVVAATGCFAVGATTATAQTVAGTAPSRTPPPVTGAFDYQLGGDYPPPEGVTTVARDSTGRPAKGLYSICYVNGFQTQPGVDWPSELILHTKSGAPLVDPGWPDEHIIDTSTPAKRTAAAAKIATSTAVCARKGFDAVEFDNLDSYSRSKGALSLSNAVSFATMIVADAHRKDLAAGQKNTAELGARGKRTVGYDFAVSEECDTYRECGLFAKVYGQLVFDIEYTDDLRGTFAHVCARTATPAHTILRDRNLTTPARKAYVYQSC